MSKPIYWQTEQDKTYHSDGCFQAEELAPGSENRQFLHTLLDEWLDWDDKGSKAEFVLRFCNAKEHQK